MRKLVQVHFHEGDCRGLRERRESTFRGPEADNEGRESVIAVRVPIEAVRVPIEIVRVTAGRESANRGHEGDDRP